MCRCARARHSRSYSTERQSLGVSLFTFTTISSSSRCPPDTRGRHERKGEGEGLRAREATLFTNLIQWTLTSIFLSCTCTLAGLTNSATHASARYPSRTHRHPGTHPPSLHPKVFFNRLAFSVVDHGAVPGWVLGGVDHLLFSVDTMRGVASADTLWHTIVLHFGGEH